jgi:hypothetical protein
MGEMWLPREEDTNGEPAVPYQLVFNELRSPTLPTLVNSRFARYIKHSEEVEIQRVSLDEGHKARRWQNQGSIFLWTLSPLRTEWKQTACLVWAGAEASSYQLV